MDRLADEAVQMLKGMVAIPSVSFEEDRVRDYISEVLKGYGVRHETVKNNIVALDENFSPEKKTLMLCAHIDTVPPGTGYSFDPYRPDYGKAAAILGHSEDELVCGLGSNDDGGSVVSLCAAFRHFRKKDLPFNIVLVLCCEEERSGPGGMTWIWEHYNEIPGLENAGKPDWAIIGEPTGMKAATSERGLLVIDGEAEGVSGHAARGEGINALYIALEDIDRLRKFDFRKVSPVMGRVRLTVTQINAGTAHNVVTDRCRFDIVGCPGVYLGNCQPHPDKRRDSPQCRSGQMPFRRGHKAYGNVRQRGNTGGAAGSMQEPADREEPQEQVFGDLPGITAAGMSRAHRHRDLFLPHHLGLDKGPVRCSKDGARTVGKVPQEGRIHTGFRNRGGHQDIHKIYR